MINQNLKILHTVSFFLYLSLQSLLGLDKICLAKFEQNGQPKERSNSASKMGCQFCQKSKMGQRMSFEFLDCMALATSPMGQCFQTGTVSLAIFCCNRRVYSILLRFTALQQSSLKDYLELSVMLQYNIRFSNFCLHFNYSMKKGIFGKQNGWNREQNGWIGKAK